MPSKNDEIFIAHCNELRAYVKEHHLFPSQCEDYETLRHSGRCASFGKFLDSLLDNVEPELS